MSYERSRLVMIVLFAAAALFSGLGNALHEGWLIALAFTAFGGALLVLTRWRRARRANVFDREEKTGN